MEKEFTQNKKLSYLKVIPCEEINEDFCKDLSLATKVELADWSKSAHFKDILPFLHSINRRDESILITFNLFDLKLLNNFPSSEALNEHVKKNKILNQEIGLQQAKDLRRLGVDMSEGEMDVSLLRRELGDEFADAISEMADELFIADDGSKGALPTSDDGCSQEMIAQRLLYSVEELMADLLNLQAVDEASMSFRSAYLDKGLEINCSGSSEDGIYICSLNDLTEISTW